MSNKYMPMHNNSNPVAVGNVTLMTTSMNDRVNYEVLIALELKAARKKRRVQRRLGRLLKRCGGAA